MPAFVQPDPARFWGMVKDLEKKGFRRISRNQFPRDQERLGIVLPERRNRAAEVGLRYDENGLQVRIWTTYLESEERVQEEDEAWVIIREGDKARYFSHPIHRTKNFLERLWKWAQVAQQRVKRRPLCPCCKAYMQIANGKGLKSRYWECRKSWVHDDRQFKFLDWDIGLSLKARDFVTRERRLRRLAEKRRGVKQGGAMLNRNTAIITRPENLILS
jgi:hypothetical protein